jgi:alkaline phosphatase
MLNKIKLLVAFVVLFAALCVSAAPKYVFLLIGDGMAVTQRKAAEDFSVKIGNGPLYMNALPNKVLTTTHSANKLITDSAAAATAIACGSKAKNYSLGIDAQGSNVYSCAVSAKKAGKKVGIMTTVTITHATPAGFYAHREARGQAYEIGIDLVHSGFDFFAGGGLGNKYKNKRSKLFKKYGHGYRYAESNGYKIVKTKADFLKLKPDDGKILTRFTNGALPAAIDLSENSKYPTLAQIVTKAIEMLDGPEGFFIMAEGGRIDWAGHANDAATNIRETLAFDEAVKVALDFQEKNPDDTIVIVTGDHETGGMTMGIANTGHEINMERLTLQTMSADEVASEISKIFKKNENVTFNDIKPLATKAYGLKFEGDPKEDPMVVTADDMKTLVKTFNKDLGYFKKKVKEETSYMGSRKYKLSGVLRRILEKKAGVSWTTGGHTAQPVLTTAKGPGTEFFNPNEANKGKIDNTDIAKFLKSLYEK